MALKIIMTLLKIIGVFHQVVHLKMVEKGIDQKVVVTIKVAQRMNSIV